MRLGDGRPGRFHECESVWLRSYALDAMKILVVCRGPVRKEALSLGSVSRIVMPGTSRRVLAENLDFLMRTYTPSPMAGPQREFE